MSVSVHGGRIHVPPRSAPTSWGRRARKPAAKRSSTEAALGGTRCTPPHLALRHSPESSTTLRSCPWNGLKLDVPAAASPTSSPMMICGRTGQGTARPARETPALRPKRDAQPLRAGALVPRCISSQGISPSPRAAHAGVPTSARADARDHKVPRPTRPLPPAGPASSTLAANDWLLAPPENVRILSAFAFQPAPFLVFSCAAAARFSCDLDTGREHGHDA